MPCGLHSAISGILAGGILGFGTADRLCFAPSPRSCCDVWLVVCLLSARSFLNSSAHKLPSFDRARPSLRGVFVFFVCWVVFFFVWVLLVLCLACFLFLGFWFGLLSGLHPRLDFLDCVMVHALFRLPNEGCSCTLHNSFNGTNTV